MSKKILIFICISLILITGCGSKKDLSSYKSVWKLNDSSISDEEVIITNIKDDDISFDYLLYRLGEFNGIEAKLDGDTASFEKTNDLGWTIKGSITLKDDKVTLKITDSSIDLIEKETKEFKVKSDNSSIKDSNVEPDIDLSNYVGVWRNDDSSNPVDEFIIKSIDNDIISFEYLIDGITTFENATAVVNGNQAEFDITNELGWNLKGNFVMENDKVTLNITDSSSDLIQLTSTTYELKRTDSKLK